VLITAILLLQIAAGDEVAADNTSTTAPTTATAPTTTTAATTAPATQPAASDAAAAAAREISLGHLTERFESTSALLKRAEGGLSSDRVVAHVDERIGDLTTSINLRATEGEELLARAPSLDTIRGLEREWSADAKQLSDWSAQLSERAAALGQDDRALADSSAAWQKTLNELRDGVQSDADVVARVEQMVRQISDARARIASRGAQVHALQTRVATLNVRIAEAITAVRDAQAQAVGRLLQQDSTPLWSGKLTERQQNVKEDSRNSLRRQWAATWAYARRHPHYFGLYGTVLAILALGAIRLRHGWGDQLEADPDAKRNAVIFQMPLASAIVATLPAVRWFFPEAPRLLMALLGATLLVPAILLLRRVVFRPVIPLLNALAAFYVLGLIVSVTGSVPALSRALFLLNMVAGVALVVHFLWRTPRSESFPHFAETRHYKVIRFALQIALTVMSISVLANVFGFVNLSRLLGNGVLVSAYVAIMLDACVRVAAALLAIVLHIHPISEARIVQRHGPDLRRRISTVFGWLAALWWALITLDTFSIREPVVNKISQILTARWGVGAVDLSLGGLLAFAAAVAGSFLLSRLVRFILAEDVYPRVHLARGVPYAISTLFHYSILFVGFLIAVAALGYDMTKFTILAGAFGVGLGFGMQNIVNNFVSGLILLFERPIQVGDVIELDPATVGVVVRIGIRASVLRMASSAEVIVPNGMLIANRVTNWTLTNRQRGFEIELCVAGGVEPSKVIELLTRIARETPGVARTPAPEAFMTAFLPNGGLKFELRAWSDRVDDWVRARSELVGAVNSALAANDIPRA
jgi:potassium efflux system protein